MAALVHEPWGNQGWCIAAVATCCGSFYASLAVLCRTLGDRAKEQRNRPQASESTQQMFCSGWCGYEGGAHLSCSTGVHMISCDYQPWHTPNPIHNPILGAMSVCMDTILESWQVPVAAHVGGVIAGLPQRSVREGLKRMRA